MMNGSPGRAEGGMTFTAALPRHSRWSGRGQLRALAGDDCRPQPFSPEIPDFGGERFPSSMPKDWSASWCAPRNGSILARLRGESTPCIASEDYARRLEKQSMNVMLVPTETSDSCSP